MSETLTLNVDLDDLTLDEIDAVETIADAPLDALTGAGLKKAKFLRALAVVAKHREDPEGYPILGDGLAESIRKVGSLKLAVAADESDTAVDLGKDEQPES